jgi:hypothetical protein
MAASATVVLATICVWLGWNVMTSPPRPSNGGDRGDLQISSIDVATGMRDAVLFANDMMPGVEVTSALTVVNSGSRAVSYTMRPELVSAGGVALSAALMLTVKTVGSSCADFDGTILFEGSLDAATIGSDGSGRPLPAVTAEILCFRALLPQDAGNSVQGANTTVTLAFQAGADTAGP